MSNNFSILVIDDEAQIRKLLEITLEANDFKVLFAVNGKEGIAMAASHQPDLILLDLGLPDEDGQIILKKLREWYQNPIIILSVKSTEEEIVKALDSGANDYLTKPFRTQELLARIRTALRNKSTVNNESTSTFGNCVIDLTSRIVKVNNEIIKRESIDGAQIILTLKHGYGDKEVVFKWNDIQDFKTPLSRINVNALIKELDDLFKYHGISAYKTDNIHVGAHLLMTVLENLSELPKIAKLVKTTVIKCVDCSIEREVKTQDKHHTIRCVNCQKIYTKNKAKERKQLIREMAQTRGANEH